MNDLPEQKLKLETEIEQLKRDQKRQITFNDDLKSENLSLIDMRDKNQALILEQNQILSDVTNQISEKKLSFEQYVAEQTEILEEKHKKCDEILRREQHFVTKEAEIAAKFEENKKVLATARTIELENKDRATELDVRERELTTRQDTINTDINNFAAEVASTKEKFVNLITTIQSI